jgi:hypothetical protein
MKGAESQNNAAFLSLWRYHESTTYKSPKMPTEQAIVSHIQVTNG